MPLLEHVFGTLRDSGVDEPVVVVGYGASAIIERFGDEYRGLSITYAYQRDQLGLGHAVLQAEPHGDGPFVVLNGDNIVAGDLRAPIERLAHSDVDAVNAVEEADRETARTTGVTLEDGRVRGIVEKPDDPPSTLVTTGSYVLPAEVFDALRLLRPSDRGEYELTDAIDVYVRAGATLAAVELETERVNVNTPADVELATELLADQDFRTSGSYQS